MASPSPSGEIHVILGPMFAGKTTALLRRIQAEKDCGRSVAVIKPKRDTRYGLDSVVTHDGVRMPCFSLSKLSALRDKIGDAAYQKLNVIGIDEAQFFKDLYDFCCNAADLEGKIIVVAGLDGDYLSRNKSNYVNLHLSNYSVLLPPPNEARCEICSRRAFFTLRKTNDTQTELIAGADVYMPVCRQHYVNGKATKSMLALQVSSTAQSMK
ncbi:thymidine kinase-like [Zingiber officinale]|uniref:thymidine kinase-like n=1 Tax=Zingiber officinale TaxID=94328 RepID=UPI001C4BBFC2|nr:thymidine kinase-like [Zingiber officinale]